MTIICHFLVLLDKYNASFSLKIICLYSKLIPLLRDNGIHNLDNRKEWPLSVMRQVLFELMEETPKDLLSLNLYLSSKTADEWYQLTSNLTRSIAVMSVIGYVIGMYMILMVFLCLQILTIDGAAIVALVFELNVVGFLLKISAKKIKILQWCPAFKKINCKNIN